MPRNGAQPTSQETVRWFHSPLPLGNSPQLLLNSNEKGTRGRDHGARSGFLWNSHGCDQRSPKPRATVSAKNHLAGQPAASLRSHLQQPGWAFFLLKIDVFKSCLKLGDWQVNTFSSSEVLAPCVCPLPMRSHSMPGFHQRRHPRGPRSWAEEAVEGVLTHRCVAMATVLHVGLLSRAK